MTAISIRPANRSEQRLALELLFCEQDDPQEQIEETLTSVESGKLSLTGLLLAEWHTEPVGAGLFTEQAGRVAFVWPPGVLRSMPNRERIQDALMTAIKARLDETGIRLGQVLLDPKHAAARRLFERNGFPHLTDLYYMLCPATSPKPRDLPRRFEAETFDERTNLSRFLDVLQRTYIQTLDCPELDGLRTPEDALAAHRGTGHFDPEKWWLFRHGSKDAGLLLLSEHPGRDLWELVYLGVVPEARGLGLGEHMVQWAITEAHRREQSLVLAVDGRNHLARKIYQRCGFLDLTLQSAHVRQAAGSRRVPQFTDYAQPAGTGKRKS